MTVSIIVPVHEGQDKNSLRTCLESLLRLEPRPAEIRLVSDGRFVILPDTVDSSRITLLSTGNPSGPAVARNLGAAQAVGDILLFIDSDIQVPESVVACVQRKFEEYPELAALFGSYDAAPSQSNFLSQYRNLLHHHVHQTGKEAAFTFWSGCGAIRRSVFREIGGFDGLKYPKPSIEDIELGYRLRKAGYSIRLCKDLHVKHLKRWEADSMLKADFFHRAMPWTRLLLEEQELANDLNLKQSDRLSVVLVFLMALSSGLTAWVPILAVLFILSLLSFLFLNRQLYRFFYQLRGGRFTLRAIPWHLVFYGLSGLAFAAGLSAHYWRWLLGSSPKASGAKAG